MEFDFTIGKYTLESLTNGMYASPFDLYREYIQNAVDSFDELIDFDKKEENFLKIDISLDTVTKQIRIRDNGLGISSDRAAKILLDIGNSQKKRQYSRGFRGIGRLSGLGYCDRLTFVTSSKGDGRKTEISFNAKKLKELLLLSNDDEMSLQAVIEEIVSIKYSTEKLNEHYFEVILENVELSNRLLDEVSLTEYLVQHCPLPFSRDFTWASVIISKFKQLGCNIIDYNVDLIVDGVKKSLYKPYTNSFISDRIKKSIDSIHDIEIVPFYCNDSLSAILWFASTDYVGTIMDNTIKGIRIRQGNILVGDKSTCNHFFKEERFNGWLIGELHVLDPNLIINSRRDDFEKNESYYNLLSSLEEWAQVITKEIRKKSYERSLSVEKRTVIENEDVNALNTEMLELDDCGENQLIDVDDSSLVADTDFFSTISKLLSKQKAQTKYSALNINDKLTVEQRKILERVFDIIKQEFNAEESEKLISILARKF